MIPFRASGQDVRMILASQLYLTSINVVMPCLEDTFSTLRRFLPLPIRPSNSPFQHFPGNS